MRWPRSSVPVLMLCALALAGCVRYSPKPLDVERSAKALDSRTLTDPGLRDYVERYSGEGLTEWPPGRWDFPLLTYAALYFSPDLAEAWAAEQGARADLRAVGLRQDPGLSASVEHRLNNLGEAPASTWGPTLDVPITTAGKLAIRQAESVAPLKESHHQLVRTAWRVRISLRSALVEWDSAEEQEWARVRLVQSREEVLDLMEAHLDADEASEPEVELARAEAEATRLSLASARQARAVARARLAKALGVPSVALEGVVLPPLEADLPDFPAGPDARRQTLTGRSDLLAALSAYAASDDALRPEVVHQYPDLHLQPGYLRDQASDAWALNLLVLPFAALHFGRFPSDTQEAE